MCFIHAADLLHLNFANGFLDCEFHLLGELVKVISLTLSCHLGFICFVISMFEPQVDEK